MRKTRFLTVFFISLIMIFAFSGTSSAQVIHEDTVYITSVQVDPSPTDPVVFNVPVYIYAEDYRQGASLGHYFSSSLGATDYLTIDSVNLTGGVASHLIANCHAHDSIDLGVIGFIWFGSGAPMAPGYGLLANMWFTLEPGAPDHIVTIDSGFFPPSGYYITTGLDANSRFPSFYGGTITVGNPSTAELVVDPLSITYNATVGDPNPTETFDITEASSGTLNWTASSDAAWLTLSDYSGSAPSTVTATVDLSGLTPNTYTATITVDGGDASNSPQYIAVELNLSDIPPEIALSTATLEFEATMGGDNPTAQILTVTNDGGQTLNWSASKGEDWLGLNPTSGSLTGGAGDDISVSIDITGLAADTYTDVISVSGNADNSPQDVTVTLTINEPDPVIALSTATLEFEATVGGDNPVAQILTVTNDGGQTLNWSASKGEDWLGLDPTSGSLTGGAGDDISVSVDITGLAADTYTDVISVSGNADNSPQDVSITLVVHEAEPEIEVNPDAFVFEAVIGNNPDDQSLNILNAGGGTYSFTLTNLTSWLGLSATSGVAPETIILSVNTVGMSAGTYYETITVTSAEATNSPVDVEVVLNILEPDPIIVLSQTQFTFTVIEDFTDTDNLEITNGGGGTLNWSLGHLQPWLIMDPESGVAPATVALTVDADGMTAGVYYDTISVVGVGATNSPQEVEIVLNVVEQPEFTVSQEGTPVTKLYFSGTLSKSLDPQTITVGSDGVLPLEWTTSLTGYGFVVIDPEDGTTPTEVEISVDLSGFSAGVYTDTIEFRDSDSDADDFELEVELTLEEAVQAEFVVNPSSFSFETDEGVNPSSQTLNIGSDGEALTFVLDHNQTWLALAPDNGTTDAVITLSVDVVSGSLAAGVYYDTIAVVNQALGKQAADVLIPVELTVNEVQTQPVLYVNPLSLDFEITQGAVNPDPEPVNITNAGTGDLNWVATYDAGWVTVSSLSGTAPSTIDVGVDATGLAVGTFIDTVTITADGADNSPQYIVVNLIVNPQSSQGGDTVWVGSETTYLGQHVMVEINFINDNLITGIEIPLLFDKDIVQCDSVSYTGTRVENVQSLQKIIDNAAGTIHLGVIPFDDDPIQVGSGLLAKLYFTGLALGTSAIDTAFISPAGEYIFVDEFVQAFYPEFYAGSVEVLEPVAPCIAASPDAFIFEGVYGGSDPATQQMLITNCGSGDLAWSAANSSSWLSLDPVSGGDGDTIALTVSLSGLDIDSYQDSIILTDVNATNSPLVIPVSLTVNAPGPDMDTVRVHDVTVISSATDPVPFTVPVSLYNTDTLSAASLGLYYNPYDYVTLDSINLLGGCAENTVENCPDPSDTINLGVIGFVWFYGMKPVIPGDSLLATMFFTLDAGAPDHEITIDSGFFLPAGDFILTDYGGNTVFPAFRKGTITVVSEEEPPVLSVNPLSLLFEGEEGGVNNVIQDVEISNTGSGDLNWSVSYSASWLSVDPTSGINDGTISVSVDLSGLTADIYVDTINITADGAVNSPQSVVVTLEVTTPIPTSIAGTVVEADDGDPIEDATVALFSIYPGTPLASTATDVDGYFEFTEVTAGEYVVRAYKDGYYPGMIEINMLDKEDIEIPLVATADIIPTYEWVNFYCDMNYINDGLIQPGDVIEAFDPDGVLCGQWFVTEEGTYGLMPVYRDDEYSEDVDEGCDPGDEVSFKINGYVASTEEDVFWTEFGADIEACLDAQSVITKCIDLNAGWNLISWNVDTEADDVETLIADIKSNVDVILGFEVGALTYDPNLPEFNTLEEMDHYHGYWFRMLEPATLCVTGVQVDANTPIALEMGWNLVSYLPNEEDDVEDALSSIMDYLLVVLGFYDGGVSYDPNLGEFSTLLTMMPDYGYWIKVNDDVMLTYPGGGVIHEFAKIVPDEFSAAYGYQGLTTTNRWIDVFGADVLVDGKSLEKGTYIEALDADGNICGAFTVTEAGRFGFMPVYGAEEGSSEGLREGDLFTLRIDGQETEESFSYGTEGSRILVNTLTLKGGSSSAVPTEFSLNQNYPNPFNPETIISFELPNEARVELVVFNILGEKVTTLVNETRSAGKYDVVWNGTSDDGSQVSSGIYFYRLNAGDYVKSMKMTLMK